MQVADQRGLAVGRNYTGSVTGELTGPLAVPMSILASPDGSYTLRYSLIATGDYQVAALVVVAPKSKTHLEIDWLCSRRAIILKACVLLIVHGLQQSVSSGLICRRAGLLRIQLVQVVILLNRLMCWAMGPCSMDLSTSLVLPLPQY